ncbi:MAG: DUF2807 domain-containing protein [Clostridia bacterium]|nr:DUF2807 domain-containing protein [Clostridia bacterium]
MAIIVFRRKLLRIIVACVSVLFILSVALLVMKIKLSNLDFYANVREKFAVLEATGEDSNLKSKLSEFHAVDLFSYEKGKTVVEFENAIPNLKIVNSESYSVEIASQADLIDKLDVYVSNGVLYIDFKPECYNSIYSFTYRESHNCVRVNCSQLDVTVYAPIYELYSSAELSLDYDAPKTKLIKFFARGTVNDGKIYNIDADRLYVSVAGSSTLNVTGKAEDAEIIALSEARVNATGLNVEDISGRVENKMFSWCYVKWQNTTYNSFGTPNTLSSILYILLPIALLAVDVVFIIKLIRRELFYRASLKQDLKQE